MSGSSHLGRCALWYAYLEVRAVWFGPLLICWCLYLHSSTFTFYITVDVVCICVHNFRSLTAAPFTSWCLLQLMQICQVSWMTNEKSPMVSGSTGLCTFNRKLILSFTAYFTTYQCADANASTALAESPYQLGAFCANRIWNYFLWFLMGAKMKQSIYWAIKFNLTQKLPWLMDLTRWGFPIRSLQRSLPVGFCEFYEHTERSNFNFFT